MGKRPEQVRDVCPAASGGVSTPVGRRPSCGQPRIVPVHPFPCRADNGAFVGAGELIDFLSAARGDTDFAVDQAAQPRGDRSLVVVCAAADQGPHHGGHRGRCSRTRAEPRGKGPFPLRQHAGKVGVLSGQACNGGLFGEHGVDFGAEVAYRPPPKSGRRICDTGDLDVVDPLVGQLSGQRHTLKHARVQHDCPHRPSPVRRRNRAKTDPLEEGCIRVFDWREMTLVIASARHQRSPPSASMWRAMSA
ncbi:hypothetical protein DSM43518_03294 [Mycobacterium marinum]|nr:hypothetical protein DSM43518_03294 [Mycobacterium marinum]